MGINAIFFDMDGVLVFTEPIHFRAWQLLLQNRGIYLPGLFEDGCYTGISDKAMAAEFIARFKIGESSKSLLSEKQRIFLELISTVKIESSPDRDLFLAACREKYLIALVSSSSRMEIDVILKKEKLDKIFDFIVSGDDVINHKPAPSPYLLALKYVDIPPNKAIAIEDSLSGIAAAKAAGIEVKVFKGNFKELCI